MEAKSFTREELYKLVWSTPVSKLAKIYAYSDNSLRELCKKHDIPLPYIGYWQKVQHKKKVRVVPLIEKENDSTIIKLKYRREGENIVSPHSERLKLISELKNDNKLSFIVPTKMIKPEPLIAEVKLDLKDKKPSLVSGKQGLLVSSQECLDVEVSKINVRRALLFMNSFIKIAKKRGHSVSINNNRNNGTFIIIKGEPLKIRVREILKRVPVPNDLNYTHFIPTGLLTFRTGDSFREKIWRDSKKELVEEQLLSIFTYLELKAKREKENSIKWELYRKKREEEQKLKDEIKARKQAELNHFIELLDMATRWHKAKYLRKFIAAVEEKGYNLNFNRDTISNPLQWAKDKADWYDPLVEKEDEWLKKVNRDHLK